MKAGIENKRGRRTLAETSLMIGRGTRTRHCRGLSSFALLEADKGRRAYRKVHRALRTAAPRSGGSGVAPLAFPFPLSDLIGWGDTEGERIEP